MVVFYFLALFIKLASLCVGLWLLVKILNQFQENIEALRATNRFFDQKFTSIFKSIQDSKENHEMNKQIVQSLIDERVSKKLENNVVLWCLCLATNKEQILKANTGEILAFHQKEVAMIRAKNEVISNGTLVEVREVPENSKVKIVDFSDVVLANGEVIWPKETSAMEAKPSSIA